MSWLMKRVRFADDKVSNAICLCITSLIAYGYVPATEDLMKLGDDDSFCGANAAPKGRLYSKQFVWACIIWHRAIP